jgi:hypothetical protein
MNDFLGSLKQEAVSYRKTSQQIDNFRRELTVRFEDLQVAANHRVFQIKRPLSVLERTESIAPQKTDRPTTGLASTRPQTARVRSIHKHPEATRQPDIVWVTQSNLPRGRPKTSMFDASSHHFDPDFPTPPEAPKTARVSKTPLAIRRMQTVHEDY